QLVGQGFIVDQSSGKQSIEPMLRNGANALTFVYETILTPIASGKIKFYAQGWHMANRFSAPVIVNNVLVQSGPEHILLDSDPVEMTVRPLPVEGRLAGFTGAVGDFSSDTPRLGTNVVRVGEPLRLSVTYRGQGNLARLVPPPVPFSRDWQALGPQADAS